MWQTCLSWINNKQQLIAKLPPGTELSEKLDMKSLPAQLKTMGAEGLYIDEASVELFIKYVQEKNKEAHNGIVIAEIKNATLEVILEHNDMLASMKIVGAYGGKGLSGVNIVHALAVANVTKGINKLALRKVMAVSNKLGPGEEFIQAVAQGKNASKGKDAQFVPLVKDITKQILRPQNADSESSKIDMRDLGETITVEKGDAVMKRIPATKGEPGFTVLGDIIPPLTGNDAALKASKGTQISASDENILVASESGMPLIKDRTVEVDKALCLDSVGVATGHVKFKGNVMIAGNIETGMVVKATGNITVGGFIESADVQAQGDITVAKGIIGHTVSDGEPTSCSIKTKGTIKASYAQFSSLQAGHNIELGVHCLNNEILCGQDLLISDNAGRTGTLGGGNVKVGGRVYCIQLGVEGDTVTRVQAFARFSAYKDKIAALKEQYTHAQEATMTVVRKELEFKKKPKAERSEEERKSIEELKQKNNQHLEHTKMRLNALEKEFELELQKNTIQAKDKVFTRVTVIFGDESVTTKRTHGGSIFRFNQYEIQCASTLQEDDIAETTGA